MTPKQLIDCGFVGKGKRLVDIDLPLVGRKIGVGEDEVHAILDVESAGTGFDVNGRPKMLFEPHVFFRELGPGKERDAAVAQGLAYAKWKPGAYPRDSYPRLIAAIKINALAALRSASWGLGQIMGFNYKLAGYATVNDMVSLFLDSEREQLAGMIEFIKNAGLGDKLRRRDWPGFARGFNGDGQVDYYAGKLKASFDRWQRIKDTPVPASTPSSQEISPPVAVAPVAPRPTPEPKIVTPWPTVAVAAPIPAEHWTVSLIKALFGIR